MTDVADGPHITPTYVAEGIPFDHCSEYHCRVGFTLETTKYVTPDDQAHNFRNVPKRRWGMFRLQEMAQSASLCFV